MRTIRNMRPLAGVLALALGAGTAAAAELNIEFVKTPDGGIQPQAVVDGKGTLHLVYFKGRPGAGDLFYVRRAAGKERFTSPMQVNSQAGSAIAIGTIRGGQLAVGKGGRVHVAWNGSSKARPRGPARSSPMLYARLNDDGTAFEPQRNLMQMTEVLDGGGSVAADDAGNVYVAWHGKKADAIKGEEGREVWVARSTDDGKTFAREAPAWAETTGACGCCALRAFADRKGELYLLYRSAKKTIHRDIYLLTSKDHGKDFTGRLVQKWETDVCPMSSEAFAAGRGGVFAAWETKGQVVFARIDPKTGAAGKPRPAPGRGGKRKHPALAVNGKGALLVAWTEGTGWERGGGLAWQVYDGADRPVASGRKAGVVPVWGLVAAVATPDGEFLIFY